MSTIEYYLQNQNFSHLSRPPYYEQDLNLDHHFSLADTASDNLHTLASNYPNRINDRNCLTKTLLEGGGEDCGRNEDDDGKSLSDNIAMLKTLDHNDIATTTNHDIITATNFNNSDFNYTYNKPMFGFSSYEYKPDASQIIPSLPPTSCTNTTFSPFNRPFPDNYFSPPLLLPYNNDQSSDKAKKRSPTITKKERRRTHSINTAFSALRNCIPNVPSDTKLSKIKTLRLATSYIAFLMNVLDKNDPKLAEMGFKADMSSSRRNENREEKRRREAQEILKASIKQAEKQPRGRTGWPQQVWASELK